MFIDQDFREPPKNSNGSEPKNDNDGKAFLIASALTIIIAGTMYYASTHEKLPATEIKGPSAEFLKEKQIMPNPRQ